MGIVSYIASIAYSVSRNKKQKVVSKPSQFIHPIHTFTKEQFLKWGEEGKCQCCGGESGKYKGICDECRLS